MAEQEPETASAVARFVGTAFRQYAAEILRFLLRHLRRAEDADGLTQEVFMRLGTFQQGRVALWRTRVQLEQPLAWRVN